MNVLLLEDAAVARLAPITYARPAYRITCGGTRLLDLAKRVAPVQVVVRSHLESLERDNGATVVSTGANVGPALWINARLAPSLGALRWLRELVSQAGELVVTSGDALFAAKLERSITVPTGDVARALLNLPVARRAISAADAKLLDYPHDVIRHHGSNLRETLEEQARDGYRQDRDGLFFADGATVGQYLVTDTRRGPILIDAGAEIGPFCYISGPAHIGAGARLIEHSAVKDGVTIGERAKVGGELESSIIEPYSNKQHHGFLGHSYVGSWVNLGAGTSNSDLKNTYGEVNMEYAGQKVATGMQFVGCFIGDYTKTAINTGIFTGKTIGVCSMVYGFVTTNVPSFVNYARSFSRVSESSVDVAIATQRRMFERRGLTQRECDMQLLRDLFELTRRERESYGEPLSTRPLLL